MQTPTLLWIGKTDSTNTELKRRLLSDKELPDGLILAAREQTAGRGRLDRTWSAPPGENLTFSLLLKTDAQFPKIASAPMAMGLAVAGLLEALGLEPRCKWPNDVMVRDKKICGVLSEKAEHALIVGAGVNVNLNLSQTQAIDKPATSVYMESGQRSDPDEILQKLVPYIQQFFGIWEMGGFLSLREHWLKRCWKLGQHITAGDGEGRREGILIGFGKNGELLLQNNNGIIETIWSGDMV